MRPDRERADCGIGCKLLFCHSSMRRDLTLADYVKLLQCWVLLLQTDLALRLLPFSLVRRVASLGNRTVKRSPDAAAAEVKRLDRLVRIAARRHLYPMTCLRRSLVLRWLLGRSGVPVTLKLGVRREGTVLEAHAWVEYLGQPVGEPDEVTQYSQLQLPEQSR